MMQKATRATLAHLTLEANETLKRIEDELPEHPEAMGYFFELLRRVFVGGLSFGADKKVVGLMCTQVPEELVLASGAQPLRLCSGSHAFDQKGAELLPARSCPLVRAGVGMLRIFEEAYGRKPDLIVVPTTCDQKKKSAEALTEMGLSVYYLETPSRKDTEEARVYWQDSVLDFASVLYDLTGVRLTSGRLKAAIQESNRARLEFRRLHRLMESSPQLISGTDMFLVTNAYLFDELSRWTDALRVLNDELDVKRRKGLALKKREPVRVLLTGSPPIFPNLKVPMLIESAGALIAADETCSSSRLLYDSVGYDEGRLYDLIPSVSDRYLKPCTCPFLVPNPDRKRKLIELSKRFAVDGVVYQAFSGCSPYEMEQRSVASALMGEGIPMLYVETDYSPEDTGQLSTRIEAFIESLAIMKRS